MTLLGGSDANPRTPRRAAALAGAVEGAQFLDTPAKAVAAVAHAVAGSGRRRSALSGTWLGHPLHPLLVSLPIGSWLSASVLDLTGRREAAQTLVGVGVLAALPTAVTGLSDWADTTGAERRVGLAHMAGTATASTAYGASWLARRRGAHGAGVALAVLGAAAVTAGGWLGAHLSYALGVGVDTNAFDGGPSEWTALDGVAADGPADGEAVQGRVTGGSGVAVLVATSGGRRHALGDRCSHRGAPLSDGEVAGGCVTCPWHGSRFDLATGEVLEGPAVVAQPAYELRRGPDGWEVRRDEERSLRSNPV